MTNQWYFLFHKMDQELPCGHICIGTNQRRQRAHDHDRVVTSV